MRRLEIHELLPASAVASQTRDQLLQQTALTAAGSGSVSGSSTDAVGGMIQGPVKDVTSQLTTLTAQVTALNSTQQTQIGATQDNTQAVSQNTTAKASGGSALASAAGSLASSVLGGGLSPILGGLLSLFGGSSKQTAPAPTPFRLPAPVQYDAGLSANVAGSSIQPVSFAPGGEPRPMTAQATTQITVQVNAMDSRSFQDHSEEIAQAVKTAMLNSSSLNDVIADL